MDTVKISDQFTVIKDGMQSGPDVKLFLMFLCLEAKPIPEFSAG